MFALLGAFALVVWWVPLAKACQLAWSSDAYTYLLVILPSSLGLLYTQRHSATTDYEPSRWAGTIVMLIALLAVAGGGWLLRLGDDARLSIKMLAVVLWSIGSLIFCFGLGTFKAFLFPLCFLFLIVPLPHVAVDRIIEFLQYQSAFAAEMMFRLTGVSVVRDGLLLSIPGLNIDVAPECSSIRTSELLVVTALILAHLFLRSWWRKIVLVAAAIPLSIAKNGFRMFTIALLGTQVDPGFLEGRLHHHGGILFYGLAVLATVGLLVLLRRTEARREQSGNGLRTELEVHVPVRR